MKTLLINPDVPKLYQFGGQCAFPLGLGYIAAVLEKRRDVEVIDVGAERLNDDSLRKTILKMNPEIVGITSDTLAFQRAIEIAQIVKRIDKNIIVVIGGAHSNALPTYALKYDCFDINVYGEGERTAVELWDRIDKGKSYEDVKGICFRGKDGIVVNPRRELIENLDELPFPARHLFPMDKYSSDIHLAACPTYSIGTSRGCPFSCAFCSCSVAFGRKYRFRSPKNVVDEIEVLIKQYNAKGIYFREDLFTVNKQRVVGICDEIGKRGLNFSWECESRVDTMDEEMLQAMKKAGCDLIWCGVESGSQRILEYLNKQITLSQVREAFDICQKVGIKAGASFMIGIPGETMDEIQKSIDLAEELKPKLEWTHFNVFTAFPTSSLYEFVKENRLYEEEVNHGILIVKTAEFNREILEEIRKYANARVNRSEQPKELLSYDQYGQKDEAQGERLKLLSHLIEGQKVLEIGCGNGDLSVEIARLGFDVVGVDISKPRVQQAIKLAKKENLDAKTQFTVMDATSLESPDNSFDTVLIPEVLAHVRDYKKLMEEAVRVVRNGGRIIVSVPNVLLAPFQGVPFQGHLRGFFKGTLTTELSQYAEEITWHELPSKKWLICSFFVKKPEMDISDGPLIDILMPTYNGRKYIKNAIKSVIDQTYRNWNLVVVNDGGEDIADIIDEFKDARIKYVTAEHKGKAHALNVGIRNSSGEFIGYLDDDDILYPLHLKVLVKAALEENKDFIYCDWYETSLDENNTEVGREFRYRLDVAPWMLIRQNYINHKCILHRRSLLEKAGMYDEELDVLIDWDIIRRLSFACSPHHVWAVTSERISYYSSRVLENRISGLWRRNPDKARRSVERITNKTMNLPATTNKLKRALVDAMLHRSYYHQLEINSIIQEKASHIRSLETSLQEKVACIAKFETSLQEKDAQIHSLQYQIHSLESQMQRIQRSIPMQLVYHYQRIVEKLLRPGTRRRRYYELGLTGIRVILNEGWKSFFKKARYRLAHRPACNKKTSS